MSDQYTRITTGGSPLPVTQPVVGLLFGHQPQPSNTSSNSSSGGVVVVTDAEDAPLENIPQATTQIQLHQAVFPHHVVVGWYRVVRENNKTTAPTEEDLYLSLQLQKQYGTTLPPHPDSRNSSDSAPQDNSNNNEEQLPFLFALLPVEAHDNNNNNNNNSDDNPTDAESELPLQIFAVDATRQVLVGMDDWKLETAVAERIAVERVMKEPASSLQQQQPDSGKDDPTSNNMARQASLLVQATLPMQHSIQVMHDRWGRVQEYLEAMATTNDDADPVLLRQIQGLLLSMGPIAAAAPSSSLFSAAAADDVSSNAHSDGEEKTADAGSVDDLLQQLSLLAKTVTTIQQYTDKVKLMHDAAPLPANSSASANPVGGGIAMGSSTSASGRLGRGGPAGLFSNK